MKPKPVMSSGSAVPAVLGVTLNEVTKSSRLAWSTPPVNCASQLPLAVVVVMVEGVLLAQPQTASSSANASRANFFMYRLYRPGIGITTERSILRIERCRQPRQWMYRPNLVRSPAGLVRGDFGGCSGMARPGLLRLRRAGVHGEACRGQHAPAFGSRPELHLRHREQAGACASRASSQSPCPCDRVAVHRPRESERVAQRRSRLHHKVEFAGHIPIEVSAECERTVSGASGDEAGG